MKELRRYEHVANREHFCDTCCNWIQPGDFYEGIVYANKFRGITVIKQHKHPGCESPEDPDKSHAHENPLEQSLKNAA